MGLPDMVKSKKSLKSRVLYSKKPKEGTKAGGKSWSNKFQSEAQLPVFRRRTVCRLSTKMRSMWVVEQSADTMDLYTSQVQLGKFSASNQRSTHPEGDRRHTYMLTC
jgi:hypothetical protein